MKKIDSTIKISITHFNDDPLMWAKQPKELSFCHKLKFSNPYTFVTWWCKFVIFQTQIIKSSRIYSLKNQSLQNWVANQSLLQKLNFFDIIAPLKDYRVEIHWSPKQSIVCRKLTRKNRWNILPHIWKPQILKQVL